MTKQNRIPLEEKDVICIDADNPDGLFLVIHGSKNKELKAQILQDAKKAEKWTNLIQALGKSCNSEITTDEIDVFIKKLANDGKNAKIVDEIRKRIKTLQSDTFDAFNAKYIRESIIRELQHLIGEKE